VRVKKYTPRAKQSQRTPAPTRSAAIPIMVSTADLQTLVRRFEPRISGEVRRRAALIAAGFVLVGLVAALRPRPGRD